MKIFILGTTTFFLIMSTSAYAEELASTTVLVSLSGDPQVRDLPDTSLQDQINEQSKRNILLQKQSKLDARSQKELAGKARLYYQKGREIFKTG